LRKKKNTIRVSNTGPNKIKALRHESLYWAEKKERGVEGKLPISIHTALTRNGPLLGGETIIGVEDKNKDLGRGSEIDLFRGIVEEATKVQEERKVS